MKLTMVWFAFGMVFLMVRVNDALSCYDCLHLETDDSYGYESNCADPLESDDIPICTGEACIIMWNDVGSHGYMINRTCYASPPPVSYDQCLMLNFLQRTYTFFQYEHMCCFSMENNITYNDNQVKIISYICLCDKDYCNGNITSYVTTPVATATRPAGGANGTTPVRKTATTATRPTGETTTVKKTVTTGARSTGGITVAKPVTVAVPAALTTSEINIVTTPTKNKSSGKWAKMSQLLCTAAFMVTKYMTFI